MHSLFFHQQYCYWQLIVTKLRCFGLPLSSLLHITLWVGGQTSHPVESDVTGGGLRRGAQGAQQVSSQDWDENDHHDQDGSFVSAEEGLHFSLVIIVPSPVPVALSSLDIVRRIVYSDYIFLNFRLFFGLLFVLNSLFSLLTFGIATYHEISCFIALHILLLAFAGTVYFDFFLAQFSVSAIALVTYHETPVSAA